MKRAYAVVAAGTGEGKTLVALALARALARAGYSVAPFKSGPDFLDARLYEASCGQRARNVDLWLDGPERVTAELTRASSRGSAIVLEGMMGLFDGDDTGTTSTAHILSENDIPALLVVDGWRMSQTAAAIALGCAAMQPRVRIAGVILNRAGGAAHVAAVRRACVNAGVQWMAAIPYNARWTMPERHLGIDVRAFPALTETIDEIAETLGTQLDLAAMFGAPAAVNAETEEDEGGPMIAYAADDALWFTYPQTLDALRNAGAHCVPFSPLHDCALPHGTAGLWLGGGYPESHASELAENEQLRREIAERITGGMPAYGECGGMMYLAEELETGSGTFPMVGALRGRTSIAAPKLHIGYRRASAARNSILDVGGDTFAAYEFHYASGTLDETPAYESDGDHGAWREHVVASFLHRRFFPGDASIRRFVEQCTS